MTDSIAVFSPGFRLTDSDTGAPIIGATIEFYDAGTSTPQTVYSDADLGTSIGTSVTTDSLGYPTSNGTTKTLVYVGTSDFKVIIKDADGATIATHDNCRGALNTSGFGSDASVTASFPVTTKSLDYSVVPGDQNTIFVISCSSGDVTLTLPSAVTVGSGWGIRVQHAGAANQAILATVSSQTISEGSKSFGTQFSLALNGEELDLVSDGGNWRITSHTAPFIKVAQGIIPIIDRVSAAPGTPVQGGLYLVSSSYSTFTTGDIIQYSGASYVTFTPYTDCGWICWVADEDVFYHFRGTAWVQAQATQTVMETGTATDTYVVPGVQHYHPSSPKSWGRANVSGGTPVVQQSYNLTSITDSGPGLLTWNIGTDFSTNAWAGNPSCEEVGGSNYSSQWQLSQIGTGAATAVQRNTSGTATDPASWHFVGFGDQ